MSEKINLTENLKLFVYFVQICWADRLLALVSYLVYKHTLSIFSSNSQQESKQVYFPQGKATLYNRMVTVENY